MSPHTSRVLIALLLASCAYAHEAITTKLTYSKEIVRIFIKHCAACHRENAAGPFSVMTYESARPWAAAIKEEVLARRMPPWGAVKGFGEFQDDRALTQEEIHLISDWVEGGAPEGDAAFVPLYANPLPPDYEQDQPGRVIARGVVLKKAITLHGLRPETPPPDNTKITARLPSGEILPLIWFYGMRPKFLHQFWLRAPLKLPAGTQLHVTTDAAIRLITRPR
jgi:hypothetical protein